MEKRKLGQSEVEVSVVTFGAWAIGGFMWGGADERDAIAAIQRGIELGIDTIDTAPVYGLGLSEEIIGRAVAGRRDQVTILTKFGLNWDSDEGELFFETPDPAGRMVSIRRLATPRRVIEECEACLRRLRTDYIDLFQLHWPDPVTPVEETFEAVGRLLRDGKIRAAGVSNYSPELIERARQVVPLASNQPPYSMVNRAIEADVLPYCRKHGIGVIAYSPLQRGLLTGKIGLDKEFPPSDTRRIDRFFKPGNRKRALALLDQLRPIALAKEATLAQLVIAWTVRQPGVTAALVGARDARQVEENAGAARIRLSDEELARMDDLVRAVEME